LVPRMERGDGTLVPLGPLGWVLQHRRHAVCQKAPVAGVEPAVRHRVNVARGAQIACASSREVRSAVRHRDLVGCEFENLFAAQGAMTQQSVGEQTNAVVCKWRTDEALCGIKAVYS
jgi:hypothetical protein